MKPIILLLFLTAVACGAPDGPGESALRFIEKVRTGDIDLAPGADTAISPQTSERKRDEISRRVETLASDLEPSPLEVGPVKQQGNLAAVLIRNFGGFDPARIRVIPVALVRRGADWLAAPIPASFENSGIGYDATTRENARALEAWMLRNQVIEAETLRQSATHRMQKKIEAALPIEELESLSPMQLADAFSDACLSRNTPRVLAMLQATTAPLPDDWALYLKYVEGGLARPSNHPVWNLLSSPSVFRHAFPSSSAKRSSSIDLFFLDPALDSSKDRPSFHTIPLKLRKPASGHWYIPFPSILLPDVDEDTEVTPTKHEEFLEPLARYLSNDIPSPSHATAEASRDALLKSLSNPSLNPLLAQISFSGDTQAVLQTALKAARLWRNVHHPTSLCHPVPLAFHSLPETAVGLFLFFSPRTPDRPDLRVLYFENRENSWRWQPQPTAKVQSSLQDWSQTQSLKWQQQWESALLRNSTVLDAATTAPKPNEAKTVVESFIKAIANRDLPAALALTARLDTPKSPSTLLRNLGYELSTPQSPETHSSVIQALQGKNCTSVLVQATSEETTRKPVYPVVQTDDGPRILLEFDLFLSEKRSRKFLNRTSLESLSKTLPAMAKELEEHISKYAK